MSDESQKADESGFRETLRRAEALLFVEDLESPEATNEDLHHLSAVLRLAAGDEVICSDGRGAWRMCAFAGGQSRSPKRPRPGAEPNRVGPGLSVTGPIITSERPSPTLTVGFALQKGDRPEWTVQKLTELGIDVIVPFVSERTVVRLDAGAAARRGDRLRRVAREAAAQSRRTRLPEVFDPTVFASLPTALLQEGLLAEPGGGPLSSAATAVLVGPEGGWSAAELAAGAGKVGLGDTVLRAETAAVAAAVLLSARRSALIS